MFTWRQSGLDRLTFSVTWEMNDKAEIIGEPTFYKVQCCKANLTVLLHNIDLCPMNMRCSLPVKLTAAGFVYLAAVCREAINVS